MRQPPQSTSCVRVSVRTKKHQKVIDAVIFNRAPVDVSMSLKSLESLCA